MAVLSASCCRVRRVNVSFTSDGDSWRSFISNVSWQSNTVDGDVLERVVEEAVYARADVRRSRRCLRVSRESARGFWWGPCW